MDLNPCAFLHRLRDGGLRFVLGKRLRFLLFLGQLLLVSCEDFFVEFFSRFGSDRMEVLAIFGLTILLVRGRGHCYEKPLFRVNHSDSMYRKTSGDVRACNGFRLGVLVFLFITHRCLRSDRDEKAVSRRPPPFLFSSLCVLCASQALCELLVVNCSINFVCYMVDYEYFTDTYL